MLTMLIKNLTAFLRNLEGLEADRLMYLAVACELVKVSNGVARPLLQFQCPGTLTDACVRG